MMKFHNLDFLCNLCNILDMSSALTGSRGVRVNAEWWCHPLWSDQLCPVQFVKTYQHWWVKSAPFCPHTNFWIGPNWLIVVLFAKIRRANFCPCKEKLWIWESQSREILYSLGNLGNFEGKPTLARDILGFVLQNITFCRKLKPGLSLCWSVLVGPVQHSRKPTSSEEKKKQPKKPTLFIRLFFNLFFN